MDHRTTRGTLAIVLLVTSCLTAAPVAATDSDVEARLARLERLVEGLVARLDGQQGQIDSSQEEAIAMAQKTLAETKAVLARQTALAEQMATPRIQEDNGFRMGKTRVSYSGYVKVDAITLRTSGGELPDGSILRDFLIPGSIPVGGMASGWDTDFSARQSRFIFSTETDVGSNTPLRSLIELDFMVTDGGDERVSNSYVPRMRQAYITYGEWQVGQAWSTFQDVGALPDSLDFIGTSPGTVFIRQPLVRFTRGPWQVALETPETTVTLNNGARALPGDDTIPDIVTRHNATGDFGVVSVSGILRFLRVGSNDFSGNADYAMGYGASISGKLKVGKSDDFRFMVTAGRGLGRYIGINIVNDAALTSDGRLDPIATWSGFAAYRHFWSSNLRSSIAASYFKAGNPVELTGNLVTDQSWNALANLIWSPVKPLDIGIEYMHAGRTLEDGQSGNLQKLQISTKYAF